MFAVVLTAIFGYFAVYYVPKMQYEGKMTAAADSARPLIEALEKYRTDNGFYPTFLNRLGGKYRSSGWRAEGVLYSAYRFDWIIKSDEACAARKKSVEGWIMKTTAEAQADLLRFQQECVTGYRDYELQSKDFTYAYGTERWAFYESKHGKWSLGSCTHERGSHFGSNGICDSHKAMRGREARPPNG